MHACMLMAGSLQQTRHVKTCDEAWLTDPVAATYSCSWESKMVDSYTINPGYGLHYVCLVEDGGSWARSSLPLPRDSTCFPASRASSFTSSRVALDAFHCKVKYPQSLQIYITSVFPILL